MTLAKSAFRGLAVGSYLLKGVAAGVWLYATLDRYGYTWKDVRGLLSALPYVVAELARWVAGLLHRGLRSAIPGGETV